MSHRSILSATERSGLLALPDNKDDLIRYYTFNETDLSLIRQHRGDSNRIGFAVQLSLLRFSGTVLSDELEITPVFIHWIGQQIGVDPEAFQSYALRDETRREHYREIRVYLQLEIFAASHCQCLAEILTDTAMRTDKRVLLASQAVGLLRERQVVLPALRVIERVCLMAISNANRLIYRTLMDTLPVTQREKLDDLLAIKPGTNITWLVWLRQSPFKTSSAYILEHIKRLKTLQAIGLPDGIGRMVHQNRLLKIAREGYQMNPRDLKDFKTDRRYATLAAIVIDSLATVTDELIDLHDRVMMKLFNNAKNKHGHQFQEQGKSINEKVRLYSRIGHALMDAKDNGKDPFDAIEAILSWEDFARSVDEADSLAQPESFDHLHMVVQQSVHCAAIPPNSSMFSSSGRYRPPKASSMP